jgi:cytidyltransferase-like protein
MKSNTQTLVIASGYFNPLHMGHIEYLERSKELGDTLIVIVNSDHQIKLKGSKEFQNELERLLIINSLRCVDYAVLSIDTDRSVNKTIELLKEKNSEMETILFANGGDQTLETILERETCERLGIQLVDSLGEKIQSSSWLKDKQ